MDGRIGILAYGSLLSYPGAKLAGLIERRLDSVLTPFAVEFARAASRRSGAPTLAPQSAAARRSRARSFCYRAGRDGISYCDRG